MACAQREPYFQFHYTARQYAGKFLLYGVGVAVTVGVLVAVNVAVGVAVAVAVTVNVAVTTWGAAVNVDVGG